jgi:hypothetical protein
MGLRRRFATVAGGGVGGIVVLVIVGVIRNMMGKSSS